MWIIFLFVLDGVFGDYCDISKQHNLCVYKEGVVGRHCQAVQNRGVTEEDKIIILKTHNTYRNTVAIGKETRGAAGPQPPAANMRELVRQNSRYNFIFTGNSMKF